MKHYHVFCRPVRKKCGTSVMLSHLIKVVPWHGDLQVMYAIKLHNEAEAGVQHRVYAAGVHASIRPGDGQRGTHPPPIQLQEEGRQGDVPKPLLQLQHTVYHVL